VVQESFGYEQGVLAFVGSLLLDTALRLKDSARLPRSRISAKVEMGAERAVVIGGTGQPADL
jgi:hypothetical protein